MDFFECVLPAWIIRVYQHRDIGRLRGQDIEKAKTFSSECLSEKTDTRYIPFWTSKARDETGRDRISPRYEHDRNGGRRGLGYRCGSNTASGDDHCHVSRDQIARHFWQAFVMALGPTKFNDEALALDQSEFAEPSAKCGQPARILA